MLRVLINSIMSAIQAQSEKTKRRISVINKPLFFSILSTLLDMICYINKYHLSKRKQEDALLKPLLFKIS